MGESRGGEGRGAEGVATTILSKLIDSFYMEGYELDELSVRHITGTQYSCQWRIRGQNDFGDPFYVGVDPDLFGEALVPPSGDSSE